MQNAKIIVVGSLNYDISLSVPHFPSPGETITGEEMQTAAGGKGANQAVAASRLGAYVAMVGKVGRDNQGQFLLDQLIQSGVESKYVKVVDGCPTGTALIQVDQAGENCIVIIPGANALLSKEDVESAKELFQSADLLLLQLESPIETVERSAAIAKSSGLSVVMNPSPARILSPRLLSHIDFLILNQKEMEYMTGVDIQINKNLQDVARSLLAENMKGIILTLGQKGAILVEPDNVRHFPSFMVESIDSTAAGDAFAAGFSVAYAEKKTLSEAIIWGNAAGALATTKRNAQPSLPYRTELNSLLSSEMYEETFTFDKG
jgi:ribokinase